MSDSRSFAAGDRVHVDLQDGSDPFDATVLAPAATDEELEEAERPEALWDQLRSVVILRDDGRSIGVPLGHVSPVVSEE